MRTERNLNLASISIRLEEEKANKPEKEGGKHGIMFAPGENCSAAPFRLWERKGNSRKGRRGASSEGTLKLKVSNIWKKKKKKGGVRGKRII